ncbi:hypothetical protein PHYBLDRAFT_151080 [Phycomyces blakesleeanus NRRL 1555(-)]|uniref:Tc1-like transposase DDE domain-containing protein n=1 Tax=Phycomyces blakesleeanus (strain ATCC 8743b / DSM 1359 / FGSC 10004 / NBRC 33097 / NRRL 1555) TaxID=763407 RepID=A0A162N313_PHYB8|nr:hypothetical protein PHYBLDRAFT_151080 [Phycomyces blakesleeanus NRRL 1555(-)]OAD67998.1 hypothetical protein PHYBLDRAFT_151080 [Phycomyces blakesleeanus NRRL 1555(-)]|eukprot:XP_018286038.1 hypothetical protein PHYBLDRAFT_151080 [Phycomyces blakesleeanus NRRL 1555(-)]
MNNIGFTLKQTKAVEERRNDPDVTETRRKFVESLPELGVVYVAHCIFIDEAGFNTKRALNISILAAISNNGVESMSAKLWFILDNAPIHRSHLVRDFMATTRHHIKFLPPYSPFLNSVEESFSKLKILAKRKPGPDYCLKNPLIKMDNNDLNTQTSGNSIDKVNVDFSDFEYEANLVRNNYISNHFTTLTNADNFSSDRQYDLRDFIPEEDISCHAKTGSGYFHVCNVVEHRDSSNHSESNESDLGEAPRVSSYELNSHAEAASMKLFSMFVENNMSCNVFDKCVKIVNKYMIECSLPAINALMLHYKMDTPLNSEYTVRSVIYSICQKDYIHFDTVEAGQYKDEE